MKCWNCKKSSVYSTRRGPPRLPGLWAKATVQRCARRTTAIRHGGVDMAPGFFRTIGTAPTRLTSASTGDETKLRVRRGAQQVFACAAHRLFSMPDVIGLNFSPVFP